MSAASNKPKTFSGFCYYCYAKATEKTTDGIEVCAAHAKSYRRIADRSSGAGIG